MELVTQSLPIIDEISKLGEEGKLEPEKAEILKRQVMESVEKFLNSGATILEMNAHATQSPKVLMKAQRKFLSPSPNVEKTEQDEEARSMIEDNPDFKEFMTAAAQNYFDSKRDDENE